MNYKVNNATEVELKGEFSVNPRVFSVDSFGSRV
jgi:hypothetical protein